MFACSVIEDEFDESVIHPLAAIVLLACRVIVPAVLWIPTWTVIVVRTPLMQMPSIHADMSEELLHLRVSTYADTVNERCARRYVRPSS